MIARLLLVGLLSAAVYLWWRELRRRRSAPSPTLTTVARLEHQRPAVGGFPLEGGCDCGGVRYRLELPPLFTHCCHCRWCQRESGASYALNALIETNRLTVLAGDPELLATPSASGSGQQIARCRTCRLALWSHYAGAGPALAFVRVGTLDDPDRIAPDIHIFTSSKQPWVMLPPGIPAVPEYYDRQQFWPADSLTRYEALRPLIDANRASRAGLVSRPE